MALPLSNFQLAALERAQAMYLTAQQTADYMGIEVSTLRRHLRKLAGPPVRLSPKRKAELIAFFEARSKKLKADMESAKPKRRKPRLK